VALLLLCDCGGSELSGGGKSSAGGLLGLRVVHERQVQRRNKVVVKNSQEVSRIIKFATSISAWRRSLQVAAAREILPHLG
jgi:hypothetical protein